MNGTRLWIMGALLAVVLLLGGAIMNDRSTQLERIDARATAVETRVGLQSERVAGLESGIHAILRELDAVGRKLDNLERKLDDAGTTRER